MGCTNNFYQNFTISRESPSVQIVQITISRDNIVNFNSMYAIIEANPVIVSDDDVKVVLVDHGLNTIDFKKIDSSANIVLKNSLVNNSLIYYVKFFILGPPATYWNFNPDKY